MNDVELTTRQERLQELQTATKHRTETLGSWAVPVLTAFLFCAIIGAVALGSVTISAEQVMAVLNTKLTGAAVPDSVPPAMTDIIWDIRIPRVILATLAVLALAGMGRRISTVKLVLAGAVVSALCTAIANFIIYMAGDAEGMQSAAFWTMGSLADAKWSMLGWPAIVVGCMTVYFLSQVRALDALLLGEEMAVTLGINATRKRYIYMACMALLTGVLVSQCGIIGFVGLVIPHMSRAFVGVGHKRLLPVVVLGGAIFLVLADLLSRVLLSSGDLPIGILTALMGAPLFMKLLFGSSRNFGG